MDLYIGISRETNVHKGEYPQRVIVFSRGLGSHECFPEIPGRGLIPPILLPPGIRRQKGNSPFPQSIHASIYKPFKLGNITSFIASYDPQRRTLPGRNLLKTLS
jgi:hypothetical protein